MKRPEGPSQAAAPACGSTDLDFRKLVDEHRTRLYRFVLQRIGNASDAEDLAQQAFAEAARSIETFRGGSALSTWLYGIALNLVRGYLTRSPHRRYGFEDETALLEVSDDRPDPSRQLELSQSVALLQRELASLPDEVREVLLLVALDELSYEEAAVLLAIPVGTVRSRVSRARQTLRKRLELLGSGLDF